MSKEEQNAEEPIQPTAMGGMLLTMLLMFYIILHVYHLFYNVFLGLCGHVYGPN